MIHALIVSTILMGFTNPEPADMPTSPKGLNGPSEQKLTEDKKLLDYVWKHRKRGFKIREDQVYAFLAAQDEFAFRSRGVDDPTILANMALQIVRRYRLR